MRTNNQQNMFSLIEKKHPDQTTKEFCAANGISEGNYYYWLKKFKQSTGEKHPQFLPVQLAPADRLVIATIQLPGGSLISVYDLQVLSFMQPYL